VDFEAISLRLLEAGLVQKPFNTQSYDYDMEAEFDLLSEWISIKKRNHMLSEEDIKRLKIIATDCLNKIASKEAKELLAKVTR
jgi:aminoglycoside/choline kinase family phosphotransferase